MKSEHQILIEKRIPGYLKRREEDIALIMTMVQEKKWEDLAMLGHQWKGSGPTFGLIEIGDFGIELETAAQEQSAAKVKALLEKVTEYLKARVT